MAFVSVHFHLKGDPGTVSGNPGSGHINAMTDNMRGIPDLEIHVAVDARSCIPPGGIPRPRRSIYRNHIRHVISQEPADFNLIADISVLAGSSFFPIDINVAHVHYSVEFQTDFLSLPGGIGIEMLTVPAFALGFESLRSGPRIPVPGLLELEVVRQVQAPPVTVVKRRIGGTVHGPETEQPVKVEQLPALGCDGFPRGIRLRP